MTTFMVMRFTRFFSGSILVVLLLSACSSLGLLYRNADTLAMFYLSRYVTLTDDQSLMTRRALSDFFKWHRTTELPRYARVLDGMGSDMLRDLSSDQACRISGDIRDAVERSVMQLLPALSEVAVTITPAQIREIELGITKNNGKWDKENREISLDEQLEKRLKSAKERYEEEYGSFNEAQAKYLAERIKTSPWNADLWAKDRAENQARLIRLVRSFPGRTPAQARAEAERYFKALSTPSDAQRAERNQQTTRFNCDTASGVHQRADIKQRAHAQSRLKGYAAQLRELIPS